MCLELSGSANRRLYMHETHASHLQQTYYLRDVIACVIFNTYTHAVGVRIFHVVSSPQIRCRQQKKKTTTRRKKHVRTSRKEGESPRKEKNRE